MNHHLCEKNVVGKKSWMIQDHLIRKNSKVELTMYNSESNSISTCTVWTELKGLGLNCCVALRKPLISEANWIKWLHFSCEHKHWTLEHGKSHVVWWVQIYPVADWWAHQRKKRARRSDAPIMPGAYRTRLWGSCCDLGWIQLVRSGFSNVTWLCYQRHIHYLNILKDQVFFHQCNLVFFPLTAQAYF